MPTSQNGWSANDRSVIDTYTVPGSTRRIALRKGDVSTVLLDLLSWLHANINPVDDGILDDWGYAERKIRGSSTTLSNHASGTAFDYDATEHPLGAKNTWTAEQKRKIHDRLALYEGVIRWGADYSGRVDEMHFEINAGPGPVRRIADKIRAGGGTQPGGDVVQMAALINAGVPVLRSGDGYRGQRGHVHWYVLTLQACLNVRGLSTTAPTDGFFDEATDRLVRELQARAGLTVDGVVGTATWTAVLGNDAPDWTK